MKYDKPTSYLTTLFLVCCAAVLVYFFISSGGSYFPAWLTTLGISIALLAVLSIPRYVILSSQSVEIHSVLELSIVKFSDIERVKLISRQEMRWSVPFFGIFGIFGYYGYYINLRRMRTFKLYARRWNNFILIEDKFDNRLIFSVENPEEFIAQLEKKI